MNELQQKTAVVLRELAARLRQTPLPDSLAAELERLAESVNEPCVVAVVGQVKAGKSSFINALLGEDLAKVGVTETTATINYFRHGATPTVICHWRGGRAEEKDREFLDSLQGNDIETLRRADGIDHLEFQLPNDLLSRVTLVDTPGTNAAVEEHQKRAAEYLRLAGRLRARHHEETQRLTGEADAVIYLVGAVARVTERDCLEEFARATGGQARALNAIGVLAKVDLDPALLARRHELAAKIAGQLKESLNTALPVSAGLRRALDQLGEAGLRRAIAALRGIPPKRLDFLLENEELFRDFDCDDCPLTTAERQSLADGMPWMVFVTLARIAAQTELTPAQVKAELDELAGFAALWDVLERHFFGRSHFLRCHRLANDARAVLNTIKFTHLPQRRARGREETARRERFLRFIQQARGEAAVVAELTEFVNQHLRPDQAVELEAVHAELEEQMDDLRAELIEHNLDFEALRRLEDEAACFSSAELDELRALFGLYSLEMKKRLEPTGTDARTVRARQLEWKRIALESARGGARNLVAERALARYGLILDELRR